tara:strand:+ start:408 stop:1526 length:1119 start_codon:yes stop_codon:yes gene_type:complete
MTHDEEWLVENINYRLFNCNSCGKLNMHNDEIKNIIPKNLTHLMAVHNGDLVSTKTLPRKKIIRPSRFLKYCDYLNFNKTYFINFCDGQGWEYDKLVTGIENFSVFQFSRRKSQRDSVVLWPLDKQFMNISRLPKDDLSFDKKHDSIVWRGRISGTYITDWSSTDTWGFWIQSLVKEADDISEEQLKQIFNVPRYKAVYELSNKKYCDVSFTTNKFEQDNIEKCKVKSKYFKDLLGSRLERVEQQNSKYILVTPGNCYPTSLYWSMLSNSVVFLVNTEWETILDCNLKPWVHYVPVDPSHDDVMKKFEQLQSNPNLAADIINNAHEHLKPYANNELRDRLDYLTLCHYESKNISSELALNNVSFTRGDLGIS